MSWQGPTDALSTRDQEIVSWPEGHCLAVLTVLFGGIVACLCSTVHPTSIHESRAMGQSNHFPLDLECPDKKMSLEHHQQSYLIADCSVQYGKRSQRIFLLVCISFLTWKVNSSSPHPFLCAQTDCSKLHASIVHILHYISLMALSLWIANFLSSPLCWWNMAT